MASGRSKVQRGGRVCVKFVGKVPRTLWLRTDLTGPVLADDIPRAASHPFAGSPHPGRELGAGDALRSFETARKHRASSARTEG